MRRINFVKTDDDKKILGSIIESSGELHFNGMGFTVYNSLKTAYGESPPTDKKIFDTLASGWSNGPVKTVMEGEAK
jgi:hypothetical protein